MEKEETAARGGMRTRREQALARGRKLLGWEIGTLMKARCQGPGSEPPRFALAFIRFSRRVLSIFFLRILSVFLAACMYPNNSNTHT